MKPVLKLTDVGKCYAIFHRPADRLKQLLARGRRRYFSERWAVHGVNLEIFPGETVAIVGRNGSGKSTLLHMIAGTLAPTTGTIERAGSISALLELGSGFNPEFTGRENAFLAGAIQGFSDAEMATRIPGIEEFAGIGAYFDEPVRTYSSGMFARLAFAVAISVDPDILVVDEILSVGDERFQRKCFGRISELKAKGTTVLFVSHSAHSVLELCDRAILMDTGERLLFDTPKRVIESYHKLIFCQPGQELDIRQRITSGDHHADLPMSDNVASARRVVRDTNSNPMFDPNLLPESSQAYPCEGAIISDPSILDENENKVNILVMGSEYIFTYRVRFTRDVHCVRFGMMIKPPNGMELTGLRSHKTGDGIPYIAEGTELQIRFRFNNILMPGQYFLNAGVNAICEGQPKFLHRIIDIATFRVRPENVTELFGYVDISCEEYCTVTNSDQA